MAAAFLKTHGIDLQSEISKVQFSDTSSLPQDDHMNPRVSRRSVEEIRCVRLAGRDPDQSWDVSIDNGAVTSIVAHEPKRATARSEQHVIDGRNSFLAPSLCHPHIHLDKCFLLSDPKYADLSIEKGDFAEALSLTSQAKERFTSDDLERRGRWLIEESIAAGVTCMRAFVEVDSIVRYKCLDVGLMLKESFRHACEIQICAFAQNPVFSGEGATEGRSLMEDALQRDDVDVVGSTPYVESDEDLMRKNIHWAVEMAMRYDKHLDLHLDYNLDASKEPMVYRVIDVLREQHWRAQPKGKTVVLGHCTRLTLFDRDQWYDLRSRIGNLPISFVGLPSSDMFMMGKPSDSEGGGERVRGTLQLPQMIQQYGLEGAIAVNNVGNAFTPQGSCDPLRLASMGVGIYHAGTKHDAEVLYELVSTRAKAAIGCGEHVAAEVHEGDDTDFVLFEVKPHHGQRGRKTIQEIVYDPPQERSVLHKGRAVSLNTK
ncbi:MAG: hypothetical protein LQ346_001397 [Caloplaca aetnensis]|nr:MAG: hypothetical protein LQ346_001397 [Caloplaca aetnensis]